MRRSFVTLTIDPMTKNSMYVFSLMIISIVENFKLSSYPNFQATPSHTKSCDGQTDGQCDSEKGSAFSMQGPIINQYIFKH